MPTVKTLRRLALLAAALLAGTAAAQARMSLTFGVLNDRAGPFSDLAGEGSVVAAEMAAADFRAQNPDIEIRILSADHQNKPDVGAGIVRQWIDQDGVDVVLDVPFSS